MSKEEIALELTKLISNRLIRECELNNNLDIAKHITDTYINIYNNLTAISQE